MSEQPGWPLEPVGEPEPHQAPPPPAVPNYVGYQAPVPYYAPQPPPGTNGMAIASMVLGIVGVVIGWMLLAIPAILAVVFGHVALSQIHRNPGQGGRGMAVAGLVTGYIVIGLLGLIFVIAIIMGLTV